MSPSFPLSRLFLILICGLGLSLAPQAQGADPATLAKQKRDYESRLEAVRSVQSVLARDASRPGIGEALRKAETNIREAAEIAAVEEYEIASSILDDGNILLNTALVRLKNAPGEAASAALGMSGMADQPEVDRLEREHVLRDFDYTRSLIDALRRERGVKPEDIAPIERDLMAATQLLKNGKTRQADQLIDTTYANAKAILGRFQKPSQSKTGSAALEAETVSRSQARDTAELREQFAQRERSVLSLHSAFDALVTDQPKHRPVLIESEKMLGEARQQAKQSHYPNGIATLDRAYLLLKIGIGELQGGTEVTASKDFATPADEYRYEQGRNDDYAQLIGGLIQRTPRADWRDSADWSKGKRSSADAAARAGDWPNALKEIEASTSEFKKILRSAGFPIT